MDKIGQVESEEEIAVLDGFAEHLALEMPMTFLKSDTAFTGIVQPFAKRPLPPALYQRLKRLAGGQAKLKNLAGLLTRVVVIRDFCQVAPSLQMTVAKKMEEVESFGMRFILVAKSDKQVVAQLRANVLVISLGALPAELWLRES